MTAPAYRWSAAHPLTLGILTVVVGFLGIGSWSTMTTLSGAIIAPGQIVLQNPRQIIQHPEGGVVEAIYVTDGTEVKIGSLLMRLEGSAMKSELQIVENHLLELGAKDARLDAERSRAESVTFYADIVALAKSDDYAAFVKDAQERQFTQKMGNLELALKQRFSRISGVRSQLLALKAEQESLQTQIDLQTEYLSSHVILYAEGLVQSDELFAMKMHLAELEGRKSQLQSNSAELTGEISQLEMDVRSVSLQFSDDVETEMQSVISQQAEETERAKALRERVKALEIRAPIAGLVLGMQVIRPQTVVRAAEPLLYIIPQNGPFFVDSRVAVTDIDEVHVGQNVNITLIRDKSGAAQELTGSVFRLSADALQDERTGAPYFLVTISISPTSIENLKVVDLTPGMPVTAYLRTTSQTPLEYLLKPFVDYFHNAFRET